MPQRIMNITENVSAKSEVLNSRNNPEFLIDKLQREGKNIPDIFMCCGTEDFLLENNRDLHKFLESRNVSHEYFESKGNHDMIFGVSMLKRRSSGCLRRSKSGDVFAVSYVII